MSVARAMARQMQRWRRWDRRLPIEQSVTTLSAITRQPLVDRARTHRHRLGHLHRTLPVREYAEDLQLSILNAQSRILVRVHPGRSLGLTDSRTHQLQGTATRSDNLLKGHS